MRFGERSKLLILIFLSLLISSNFACGQSEAEKIKLHNEYANKASELREQGKLKEAVEEQKKAIEFVPKSGESITVLANLYLELYEKTKDKTFLIEAKKQLEKSTQLEPKDPIGHEMLAETLKRLGDNEEALKQLNIVIQLQPNDLDSIVNIGSIHSSLGEYKSAEESFEKVLRMNPDYIYARYQYGEFELKRGNKDKAEILFEKVVNLKTIAPPEDLEFIKTSEKKLEELKNQKSKTATQSAN